MYKLLIVEDMDLTREDIINLMNWAEYDYELVPDARNGKMGLEHFKRYRPDIVMTDIKMPIMSGLDMIEEIHKIDRNIQFILLTAYEEFDLAKRALGLGIQSFILKYEIDRDMLLKEVNRCVENIKKQKHVDIVNKRQKLMQLLSREEHKFETKK